MGEPAQNQARNMPKPFVLSEIPFTGAAGSECRVGTAYRMLQITEALPEKEKMEAVRLLQDNYSWHTAVSCGPGTACVLRT